ncbi:MULTISPECIES: TlpA family protein disulfide reductase [Niastella]|uniref:TlpA family protein disulfide reductase n=1 Tax=Niastella soli TaxID=2821487 RepID=A0ABS3YYF2_9BACT|nr:TlpA disulfide reductase family protein [Niastella soli]MBO9202952.1 TlpA family protein disulfide reductase [Niastella soli]
MQKLLFIIGLVLLVSTAKTQSVNTFKTDSSRVNQLCPNFLFDTLVNYKKEKLALADWKGKPVIIDFWGTFCLPCIKDIPILENFQTRFGDSLRVLLVATDNLEKVSQFYETRKKANKPLVLTCAIKRAAFEYFQIKELGTYVWIDAQGYVKAITDYSQLTEQNVAAFINKKEIHLPEVEKHSFIDVKRYIVTVANEMDSNNVLFNSSLTKYLKGKTSSHSYLPKVGTHLRATNSAIGPLYQMAFGDSTGEVPYSRVVIESAHPEKFRMPKDANFNEWKIDNTFCYELWVPKDRQHDILKIMQDDLKRMFGANVYLENRMQKCLVLTADKSIRIQVDKASKPNISYNAGGSSVTNLPFDRFFDLIYHYNQDKIVLDETGITENVTIALDVQMNDINALSEALKKHGLRLEYQDRSIKMLIIRDPVK